MNIRKAREIHLVLNKLYYTKLYNPTKFTTLDADLFTEFKRIELEWIHQEERDSFHQWHHREPLTDPGIVMTALKQHPVYQHPCMHYLQYEASLNDLKVYLQYEAIFNFELMDYLSISLMDSSDNKHNLMYLINDSYIHQSRTILFNQLWSDLDLYYDRDVLLKSFNWEVLANMNLFNYLSFYAFNRTKLIGALTAIELLDSIHYQKMLSGVLRILNRQKNNLNRYYLMQEVDLKNTLHEWVANMVIPFLSDKTNKIPHFWMGCYLWLNAKNRAYDRLLKKFTTRQVA